MRDFHHREKQSSAEKSRGDFENRETEGQRGILTQRHREGETQRVFHHREKQNSAEKSRGDFENRETERQRAM